MKSFSWKSVYTAALALLLTVLVALPAAAREDAALKESLLTALETQYGGKSFSAEFYQTSTLAALDMTDTATGKAWFAYPGRMKWQYLTPERHEIITNGKDLWIWRPDENQVMRGDARPFFRDGAGGALLTDMGKIRETYAISLGEVTDTHADLILIPPAGDTEDGQELKSIKIRVQRPSHQIQEVVTLTRQGDTTRFELRQLTFRDFPGGFFGFTVPEGAQILDME